MADDTNIKFCPLCGNKVSVVEKLCPNCHYDLDDYRASIAQKTRPMVATAPTNQSDIHESENSTTSNVQKNSPAVSTVPTNHPSIHESRNKAGMYSFKLLILLLFVIALVMYNLPPSTSTNSPHSENNQVDTAKSAPTVEPTPTSQPEPQPESPPSKAEEPVSSLGEHWIKDADTDIYLWNPEPQDGESISWSGSFVEDNGHKFANGNGVLTWYRDGQVIQVDEGNFEHGRHHGQFKHTFKSGNVDYSNWNHGEEIPLPPSANSAEDEARQAFVEYHRAITNKDYNSAYATLTTEQKQRVGNFNSYSAGYTDTLSSEVSNLSTVSVSDDAVTFNYRLTARDKTSDKRVKVQIFDGQVTLVKIDGRWYISNAKSHRTNEHFE